MSDLSNLPPATKPGVIYTRYPEYVLVQDMLAEGQPIWKLPIQNLPDKPGLLRKVMNFARATKKHVKAGAKRASDKTIDERFAICQACPSRKYTGNDVIGRCNDITCGCILAGSNHKGRNKLAWAEQECPQKHWKAV